MPTQEKHKIIIDKISIYKSVLISNYNNLNLLGKIITWITFISFIIGIPIGIMSYIHSCSSSNKTDKDLSEITNSMKNKPDIKTMKDILDEYNTKNKNTLKKMLSHNYDMLSVSKNGRIVPLGNIDPKILNINWDSCIVKINRNKINIYIPSLIVNTRFSKNTVFSNIKISLDKYIGSIFDGIQIDNTVLIFVVLGQQKNFYIIGFGLKEL